MNDLVTELTDSIKHYEAEIRQLEAAISTMRRVAALATEQQTNIEIKTELLWVSCDKVLFELDRENMLKLAELLDTKLEVYSHDVNSQGEATFKYQSDGDLPIEVWTGPPPDCVITQVGERVMPVWEVQCNNNEEVIA